MSQFNPFAKTGSGGGGGGADGKDGRGIVSIEKTGTVGLVDTYTTYYTDGTETEFYVTNGATGATGPQGPQGLKGDPGEAGSQGLKGDNGDSAYQIWLDEGNIGTEQDFLNSLKADKNEIEITTTSIYPEDEDIELWINLGNKEKIYIPEIDDNAVDSQVNTYSVKKINEELNNKVDKVSGMGLSQNSFTNAEKAKLADTYTKNEVDTSQAMQDARILSLEQRVDNRLEHYGMKWEKENSDPQARCTYMYDCANFTPMQCQNDGSVSTGSWANAFFIRNNYPAMVKPDGTIDYLLDPNDHSKKLDGTASHVEDHDTDNAMAVFDCHIWIKMTEDETYQYIEVANQKLDDDFVDFPYHRADGTVKDKLYYPMFEGSIIGGKLRSLATGAVPQSNTTASEEQTAAQANGANWSIGDWSHHLWITLLSMLVGKSTCPEMALGEGHTTGGSSAADFSKCGELKTSGQFYGKPQAVSTTNPVKLFFSENPYGNRWKRTLGMYNVSGTYYIKPSPPYTVDESYNGYENCGSNPPSDQGYVKDLKLTSMGFVPSTVGGSASTYTGTYYSENDNQTNLLVVGGACDSGAGCGFLSLRLWYRPSYQLWAIGASLYLM